MPLFSIWFLLRFLLFPIAIVSDNRIQGEEACFVTSYIEEKNEGIRASFTFSSMFFLPTSTWIRLMQNHAMVINVDYVLQFSIQRGREKQEGPYSV